MSKSFGQEHLPIPGVIIGMATAALILRATELGLVAYPIAGFNPKKTKEILVIPDEMEVITLVIVGRHSETISQVLSDKQVQAEKNRLERLALEKFVYINSFKQEEGLC